MRQNIRDRRDDQLQTRVIREPVVGPVHKCQAHVVTCRMIQQAQRDGHIYIRIRRPLQKPCGKGQWQRIPQNQPCPTFGDQALGDDVGRAIIRWQGHLTFTPDTDAPRLLRERSKQTLLDFSDEPGADEPEDSQLGEKA